jgi:hypothetical protein
MPIIKILIKHSILFYLIAAIAIAAFMVVASGLLNQYKLMSHANFAKGSVIELRCGQHQSFRYQFSLNDISYQGLANSDQCGQIRSGDPVLVRYLAENPRVNMGVDPKRAFVNNATTILIASLASPLVLLLIFWLKLREWQRKGVGAMVR